ncbi:MAG TPA: RNA 2',3'-cyclic phosphodiesterase [Clostridia bacterium]|nr:RNA 2',3'-cyclic phosphodiesterase [Clostridia bacterium]
MRLFVVIKLSNELKVICCDAISEIQGICIKGSFTRAENLHLTVVFVGEVPNPAPVISAVGQISAGKITLETEELGIFSRSGGDICWLGVKRTNQLDLLYNEATGLLKTEGLRIENRNYKPHITLGRGVVLPEGFDIKTVKLPKGIMISDRLSVFESKRVDGILRYTEIFYKQFV